MESSHSFSSSSDSDTDTGTGARTDTSSDSAVPLTQLQTSSNSDSDQPNDVEPDENNNSQGEVSEVPGLSRIFKNVKKVVCKLATGLLWTFPLAKNRTRRNCILVTLNHAMISCLEPSSCKTAAALKDQCSHSDILAMCYKSNIIFCDICCFSSASLLLSSLKGAVNCYINYKYSPHITSCNGHHP